MDGPWKFYGWLKGLFQGDRTGRVCSRGSAGLQVNLPAAEIDLVPDWSEDSPRHITIKRA
jgi:hypothetical protein